MYASICIPILLSRFVTRIHDRLVTWNLTLSIINVISWLSPKYEQNKLRINTSQLFFLEIVWNYIKTLEIQFPLNVSSLGAVYASENPTITTTTWSNAKKTDVCMRRRSKLDLNSHSFLSSTMLTTLHLSILEGLKRHYRKSRFFIYNLTQFHLFSLYDYWQC